MATTIKGAPSAAAIKESVRQRVAEITAAGYNAPSLAVVLAGENPASLAYIRNKEKACAETDIRYHLYAMDEQVTQDELFSLIDSLNADGDVNGIIVQQPLPAHIDKYAAVSRVDPRKDIDGLHPLNVGLAAAGGASVAGQAALLPCTPAGIIRLLIDNGIVLSGKHCVILGRGDTVGKPLTFLMLQQNATVTVCHSRTENLADICRSADILVAAIGKAKFVTGDMISPGCVVVDVGISRLEGRKICGDVNFTDCSAKASYITPVPGGVGPMTVALLMENCLKAWEIQHA